MRKSSSLFIALLVIMSMLLTSCAGAAPAQAPAATGGESQAAGGPVTIKIFSPQAADVDLATNSFTKEAEEKFGIQFEWQTTTYDGNSAKEQRQI